MKIAFTSCCDPVNDPVQKAWTALAAQKPDRLILLGDNMYMDYGLGPHPLRNGAPKNLPPDEFSRYMHGYYAMQWDVAAFRQALVGPSVEAIWDDHDFAWNNARGGGHSDDASGAEEYVPPERRRLSRALFEQFRSVLLNKPVPYPPNPYPGGVVAQDAGGIQYDIDLEPGIRLHLLDGRSFREAASPNSSLLGLAQRAALEARLLPEPGINLLASGTTLKDWKRYSDLRWLEKMSATHRILVLSGDIHQPNFAQHKARIYEATASAMAQPAKVTFLFGKKSGIFGTIDVSETALDIVLWQLDKPGTPYRIRRSDWTLV